MRYFYACLPIFVFAYVLKATIPIEQASFSELINSDIAYANIGEIVSVETALWQKYSEAAQDDGARKAQHDRRELVYGDKTMRFSLEHRGIKPATGFPVYIALHGGGGADPSVNDGQWQQMKIYYRDSVDNGIYIAPRGITDTWDLHFRDESFPLYDRLIENLVAYEGADPNKIYLLGFSAGGDGVYQIVPRMPDRFAAANMSAGHHNWIRFDNLLNTPFLLQVGEWDSAYNRNRVAAENFVTLNSLASRHGGYIHDLFIHANRRHNGWYDNDASGAPQNIISDPAAWLSGDRSQKNTNTNALHWLKNYQRKQLPLHLIWDLSTRSPRTKTWGAQYVTDDNALKATKDLFYWLALEQDSVDTGRMEALINQSENAIYLKEVTGVSNFKILLHHDVLDFSRPISVFLGENRIALVSPSAKLNVMARTLLERGDKTLMFHDEIPINLNAVNANTNHDKFSYCSNGRCLMVSAEDFNRAKNFPLDLNYTCKQDYQYALTFDDGPSANIPAIIDILARHNVKATFFVVGRNLESTEGQAQILLAHQAGHEIANHTFSHRSLTDLSADEIAKEVLDTQAAIVEVLGHSPQTLMSSGIVRPPFGNIDPKVQDVINALHFNSVRWNSDRYDWQLGPEEGFIVKYLVQQHVDFIKSASRSSTFNRSVLDLNHEASGATLSVLDEVIPMIKNAGYQLVTVSECLGL